MGTGGWRWGAACDFSATSHQEEAKRERAVRANHGGIMTCPDSPSRPKRGGGAEVDPSTPPYPILRGPCFGSLKRVPGKAGPLRHASHP